MNYARRQEYRRLSRAVRLGLATMTAALLGKLLLSVGFALPGGLLLVVAVIVGLRARHWLSLAGRSDVGARSEDEVRRALAPLQVEGWRLRHSLPWRGRGDIDSLAIAPTGVGFAVVERKTRRYDQNQLARVREQAAWLARRRRRWCRHGAVGVLCVVRAAGLECVERDVIVVSIDRLVPTLAAIANARRSADAERS